LKRKGLAGSSFEMFAILITGHDKVAPPVGDGTKARILKMLANEPTVATPPSVRMSFRKFLLLPSVLENSLCSVSVELIMFTQNWFSDLRTSPSAIWKQPTQAVRGQM
jgi:hypothetical protein